MLIREVAVAAVEIFFDIESVTSVWRSEPGARGTPAREVRRLEDVFIVTSFAVETQAAKLLIRLATLFRQPQDYTPRVGLSIYRHKTDMGDRS